MHRKRLKEWVNTLDFEKTKEILIECVDELINYETVNFRKDSKAPTWDGSGERLDGVEDEYDD